MLITILCYKNNVEKLVDINVTEFCCIASSCSQYDQF